MKHYKSILVLAVIAVFAGCKSTREFYNKKGELRNISDSKLISSVENNYLEYEALFLKKFKAEVSFNNESHSFKGNLFIAKDSTIIVSVLKGIEWFRVKLTPESVEILDRQKKTYSRGDYGLLWDKFMIELDYYTLQKILTNKLFVYPIDEENNYLKRYKHYCEDDVYELQSVREGKFSRKYKKEKTNNIIYHQFSILPDVFKISKVYIRDFSVNSEVTINYSKLTDQSGYLSPTEFNIVGKKGNESFALTINFEQIEVNGDSSIGFKVSDKYKKIDLHNAR